MQTKLKAKKSSYNSFGKYYFRKAEDILEATKPFLLELGVSVTLKESIIATDPVPMLESTAILSDGENTITATAVVGVDLNQKGMQTSQQFGAASSYGKKYALGNLFLIDDTADSDATNDHGKKSTVVQKLQEKMTKQQVEQAKSFVKKGGSIEAIKKKYKITSELEQQLKTL